MDKFLMCPPDFFEVSYVINPWMEGNVNQGKNETAVGQWRKLYCLIGRHAGMYTMPPAPCLPDMVFTANAGIIKGNKFVVSNFKHAERRGEEPHFASWFSRNGYDVKHLPNGIAFEGAGDALFMDEEKTILWMGHGHRTDVEAATLIRDMLNIDVIPLKLVDDRFYHLDTCFCPLPNGYLMYYPAAFDEASQKLIEKLVPTDKRIGIRDYDALRFACNAVSTGNHIFVNSISARLSNLLLKKGFNVHQTGLGEFMKAGGSAKCLTIKL